MDDIIISIAQTLVARYAANKLEAGFVIVKEKLIDNFEGDDSPSFLSNFKNHENIEFLLLDNGVLGRKYRRNALYFDYGRVRTEFSDYKVKYYSINDGPWFDSDTFNFVNPSFNKWLEDLYN